MTDKQSCEPNQTNIEDFKEVERFKLSIWIAKAFSAFIMSVCGIVLVSYVYLTIKTHTLPDLTTVGTFMGGFFEIIKVVVSE
jgi:hypothetical protein